MKKLLFSLAIIGSLVCGWVMIIFGVVNQDDPSEEIVYYRSLAQQQTELGGYGLAADCYAHILSLEDSVETRLSLSEMYQAAGLTSNYKNTLEDLIRAFPTDVRGYEALAVYYDTVEAHEDCVSVIAQAYQADVSSEVLQNLYYKHAYVFLYLKGEYESATPMKNGTGLVSSGGWKGIVDSSGTLVGNAVYREASNFCGDLAAVQNEERSGFISANGQWYVVLSQPFQHAYSIHDGFGVLFDDRGAVFIDRSGAVRLGPYEDATGFSNGVAAVKENGEWRLITSRGETVCQDVYDDVKRDADGLCSDAGVIFVQNDGRWRLIDTQGNSCSQLTFEDVEPFFEDSYAAVCQDGLWGFVDTEGAWALEPQLEGAGSFGRGLAPVRTDGKWGYMDTAFRMVIEPQFDGAGPFASCDVAPVQNGTIWRYIKLIV